MASTYVNDLRLEEMATGDQSGTWGDTTNVNLELIAEAFSYGTEASFSSDADATTTIADGASDPARSLYLKVTSGVSLTATRTLTIAPNTVSKVWIIENATSGSQSISISQGSGANVTIPNGDVKVIYSDGAGSGAAVVDAFTDLNLGGTTTISALSVSGTTTFSDDVTFTGASNNLVWDKSDDCLEFADNAKAKFGASDDLQIYHDGSNSRIQEGGTGSLLVRGTNLQLQDSDGYDYLTCTDGGNGGTVALKHLGSTVFSTAIGGVAVTGALTGTQSSAATAATFKVSDASAQVANVVISNNADTGLNLGVFGASAGTAGMISASDAFITTSTTELNVGVNNASGVIKLGVGSTASEKMRIDSTGVGIGTTSPDADLHVKGAGATNIRLEQGNGSNYGQIKQNQSIQALQFGVGGDFAMTINSSENVGIGTTSPSSALDVVGDIEVSGGVYLGGTAAANKLDDYEEGTFTPNLTEGTNSVSLGTSYYTKIGNLVTVLISAYSTNFSSLTAGSALRVSGLPFSADRNSHQGIGTNTTSGYQVLTEVSTTNAYIYLNNGAVDYTGFSRTTGVGGASTFSFRTIITYSTGA